MDGAVEGRIGVGSMGRVRVEVSQEVVPVVLGAWVGYG